MIETNFLHMLIFAGLWATVIVGIKLTSSD
ncbi:hypothetical protein GGQ59_001164 [Parvularcula dongshanensis]|uniref:Uncharacterized protein n=1 Tax=Parvularcula dongshanensis TaxID=1173995 RepID=A0A840I3N1_9PROT|nr:hypothetical protein [Parvularcula dongshanensis]